MIMGLFLVMVIGKNLLPSDTMFTFHDQTQYARIMEYAYSLKTLHIPPVFAPHFNFGIGYPVFLFYAPLAYFITALIHIVGIDVVTALRLSFLAGLMFGCVGMYQWLRLRFSRTSSLLGALLYISSPWMASELFVRGNLATIWFLALAPWSLWGLSSPRRFWGLKTLLIAATFLTHNALSLLWIPTLFTYSVITQKGQFGKQVMQIILPVLLTSFFWIPAVLQLGQMQATQIAQSSYFADHFLCISQIWTTGLWGFGGSTAGCLADGMSFMLGKIQIVLALFGAALGVFMFKQKSQILAYALIVGVCIFLTLYQSHFVWSLFYPLQIIQFPWRLLSIVLIFLCALGAVGFELGWKVLRDQTKRVILLHKITLGELTQVVFTVSFSLIIVLFSSKYFFGNIMSTTEVRKKYTSEDYIRTTAAYDIPEYIPLAVDYQYWKSFRGKEPDVQDLRIIRQQFETFRPSGIVQLVGFLLTVSSLVFCIYEYTKKPKS